MYFCKIYLHGFLFFYTAFSQTSSTSSSTSWKPRKPRTLMRKYALYDIDNVHVPGEH